MMALQNGKVKKGGGSKKKKVKSDGNAASITHFSGAASNFPQQISLKENKPPFFDKTPIVCLKRINVKLEDSINVQSLAAAEIKKIEEQLGSKDALGSMDAAIKLNNEVSPPEKKIESEELDELGSKETKISKENEISLPESPQKEVICKLNNDCENILNLTKTEVKETKNLDEQGSRDTEMKTENKVSSSEMPNMKIITKFKDYQEKVQNLAKTKILDEEKLDVLDSLNGVGNEVSFSKTPEEVTHVKLDNGCIDVRNVAETKNRKPENKLESKELEVPGLSDTKIRAGNEVLRSETPKKTIVVLLKNGRQSVQNEAKEVENPLKSKKLDVLGSTDSAVREKSEFLSSEGPIKRIILTVKDCRKHLQSEPEEKLEGSRNSGTKLEESRICAKDLAELKADEPENNIKSKELLSSTNTPIQVGKKVLSTENRRKRIIVALKDGHENVQNLAKVKTKGSCENVQSLAEVNGRKLEEKQESKKPEALGLIDTEIKVVNEVLVSKTLKKAIIVKENGEQKDLMILAESKTQKLEKKLASKEDALSSTDTKSNVENKILSPEVLKERIDNELDDNTNAQKLEKKLESKEIDALSSTAIESDVENKVLSPEVLKERINNRLDDDNHAQKLESKEIDRSSIGTESNAEGEVLSSKVLKERIIKELNDVKAQKVESKELEVLSSTDLEESEVLSCEALKESINDERNANNMDLRTRIKAKIRKLENMRQDLLSSTDSEIQVQNEIVSSDVLEERINELEDDRINLRNFSEAKAQKLESTELDVPNSTDTEIRVENEAILSKIPKERTSDESDDGCVDLRNETLLSEVSKGRKNDKLEVCSDVRNSVEFKAQEEKPESKEQNVSCCTEADTRVENEVFLSEISNENVIEDSLLELRDLTEAETRKQSKNVETMELDVPDSTDIEIGVEVDSLLSEILNEINDDKLECDRINKLNFADAEARKPEKDLECKKLDSLLPSTETNIRMENDKAEEGHMPQKKPEAKELELPCSTDIEINTESELMSHEISQQSIKDKLKNIRMYIRSLAEAKARKLANKLEGKELDAPGLTNTHIREGKDIVPSEIIIESNNDKMSIDVRNLAEAKACKLEKELKTKERVAPNLPVDNAIRAENEVLLPEIMKDTSCCKNDQNKFGMPDFADDEIRGENEVLPSEIIKDARCGKSDQNEFGVPDFADDEIGAENEVLLSEITKDASSHQNDQNELFDVSTPNILEKSSCQNLENDSQIQMPVVATDDKLFSCETCHLKFKHKRDIANHVTAHFEVKPSQNEHFETSSNLTNQSTRRSIARPFSCSLCSAQFKTSARLKKHTASHSSINYFSCEHCLAKFKTKSALTRHLGIHYKGKNFSFLLCASDFAKKSDSTKHLRKHPDESRVLPEKYPASTEDKSSTYRTDAVNIMRSTSKPSSHYTSNDMNNAVTDVKFNKMSISRAAKKWAVPRSTLFNKVRDFTLLEAKKNPDSLPQFFSKMEEKILVDWIIQSNNEGFLISQEQVLSSVLQLLKVLSRASCLKNDVLRKSWYKAFLKRNPSLCEIIPQILPSSRSRISQAGIRGWFEEVQDYLKYHYNLDSVLADPSRVFNADQAALYFNLKGQNFLCKYGTEPKYRINDCDEKEWFSVFTTVNAAGAVPPPMVVFKYECIPKAIYESMPNDWGIGRSESGWMTPESAYNYMVKIFHKWLDDNNIPRPVLFFVDGDAPYLTLQLSQFCLANGIILIAFFPNATKLLQPLDVTVYRCLKSAWQNEVSNFCEMEQGPMVKHTDFCPLLKRAIAFSFTPSIIIDGFKKCGLVPWCPDAVDYSNVSVKPHLDDSDKDDFNLSLAAPEVANNSNNLDEWKITCTKLNTLIGLNKVRFFESIMTDPNCLRMVDKEDSSLFSIWRQIYYEAHEKFDEVDPSVSFSFNSAPVSPLVTKTPSSSIDNESVSSITQSQSSPSVTNDIVSPFKQPQSLSSLTNESISTTMQLQSPSSVTNDIVSPFKQPQPVSPSTNGSISLTSMLQSSPSVTNITGPPFKRPQSLPSFTNKIISPTTQLQSLPSFANEIVSPNKHLSTSFLPPNNVSQSGSVTDVQLPQSSYSGISFPAEHHPSASLSCADTQPQLSCPSTSFSTEQPAPSSSWAWDDDPLSSLVAELRELVPSSPITSRIFCPSPHRPIFPLSALNSVRQSPVEATIQLSQPSHPVSSETCSSVESLSAFSLLVSNDVRFSPPVADIQQSLMPLSGSQNFSSIELPSALSCDDTQLPQSPNPQSSFPTEQSAAPLSCGDNQVPQSSCPPKSPRISSASPPFINDTSDPLNSVSSVSRAVTQQQYSASTLPLASDFKDSLPGTSVLEEANKMSEFPAELTSNLKRKRPVASMKVLNKKSNTPSFHFKPGDYVIVEYEKEYFPGLILNIEMDEARIKTMVKAGLNVWKWPDKEDVCNYVFSNIKSIIAAPDVYNKRGHYKVPEMDKFK